MYYVPQKGEQRLRRPEASKYLAEKWGIQLSARTLTKIACISSDGPVMVYDGRFPTYPVSGLDVFAQARLGAPVRSTSERVLQSIAG
ncbi:hypothetical protein [uncultured Enterovirga sp.]|uniref:hypothetical protein n=1 Tax=uncultured Enterovirga sp. TaxID=2026352 RepID=UPI0035CB72A1